MKKLIPFLLIFLIIFYILPLVINIDFILLAVSPLLVLIVSLIYGAIFGFNIFLSVLCAVLFIPKLFLDGLLYGVWLAAFFIVALLRKFNWINV